MTKPKMTLLSDRSLWFSFLLQLTLMFSQNLSNLHPGETDGVEVALQSQRTIHMLIDGSQFRVHFDRRCSQWRQTMVVDLVRISSRLQKQLNDFLSAEEACQVECGITRVVLRIKIRMCMNQDLDRIKLSENRG